MRREAFESGHAAVILENANDESLFRDFLRTSPSIDFSLDLMSSKIRDRYIIRYCRRSGCIKHITISSRGFYERGFRDWYGTFHILPEISMKALFSRKEAPHAQAGL